MVSGRSLVPAVGRKTRMLVAGAAWSGVGVMLLARAANWLSAPSLPVALALAALGVTLALLAWRYLFGRLASRNIGRISASPERACVFGFQTAKSYVVMIGMIALGIALRHSAVPKADLAAVYIAIGGGLLAASTQYYRSLATA